MLGVAITLSLLVAGLGVFALIAPQRLAVAIRRLPARGAVYGGALFRMVLGLALYAIAPDSRAPDVLRVLGVLLIVGGLIMPLIGAARLRRLLDAWTMRRPLLLRIWGALAIAFGLSLAYGSMPG